jgi:hypothetical protein
LNGGCKRRDVLAGHNDLELHGSQRTPSVPAKTLAPSCALHDLAAAMFLLGREKSVDDYDQLLASGKSFREARQFLADKERRRKGAAVDAASAIVLTAFDETPAGVGKRGKFLSTRGVALPISAIKSLSATSMRRLPEAKQPLALLKRPLTDTELVDHAIQQAYVTGDLDLKNCNMTVVVPREMTTLMLQFGNITSMNLSNNKLTDLPSGLAPLCPRLTELSVANNRLRHIPKAILSLPMVTMLNLAQNHIEEVAVIQGPEITTLRLNHNHVTSLDSMSFMKKLRSLHLDHCHLVELSSHIKKLKMLTLLDLSYNTLVSLALPSREAAVSVSKMEKKKPKLGVAAPVYGDTRQWEEVTDPVTKQVSYFCKATREVRRRKPPGFDEQLKVRTMRFEQQKEAVLRAVAALPPREEVVPVELVAVLEENRRKRQEREELDAANARYADDWYKAAIAESWQEIFDPCECCTGVRPSRSPHLPHHQCVSEAGWCAVSVQRPDTRTFTTRTAGRRRGRARSSWVVRRRCLRSPTTPRMTASQRWMPCPRRQPPPTLPTVTKRLASCAASSSRSTRRVLRAQCTTRTWPRA